MKTQGLLLHPRPLQFTQDPIFCQVAPVIQSTDNLHIYSLAQRVTMRLFVPPHYTHKFLSATVQHQNCCTGTGLSKLKQPRIFTSNSKMGLYQIYFTCSHFFPMNLKLRCLIRSVSHKKQPINLLYRHECSCKIHIKLHLGPQWHIFLHPHQ